MITDCDLRKIWAITVLMLSALLVSCGGGSSGSQDDDDQDDDPQDTGPAAVIELSLSVDTINFPLSALVGSVDEVDCTTTAGTATTCWEITVDGFPADREDSGIGDFCPENVYTEASQLSVDKELISGNDGVGTWIEGGEVFDMDGVFIDGLDDLYGDRYSVNGLDWQLYDPDTGVVNITLTAEDCDAAARPNVTGYENYCVQCDIDDNGGNEAAGTGVTTTYIIPQTPIPGQSTSRVNDPVGVAFDGVRINGPAPTANILGAMTIAVFDDCIGHINPVQSYHYHGANHGYGDCPGVEFESDGHAGAFGYALDGYAIYGMLDESDEEPTDLDECRGHEDDTRGYHYHTAGAGENYFIGCYSGEVVSQQLL